MSVLVAPVVALVVVSAAPVFAQSAARDTKDLSTERLLDALEEREMPDVVLWVLKRVADDAQASEPLKKEVPFRRAAALVAASRLDASATERDKKFDEAGKELEAFIKGTPASAFNTPSPEGERAVQAYLQKGNLLMERGRSKLDLAKRPGADVKKLRGEALPFFDAAIKTLEGPVRKEGEKIDAVANAEDAVLSLLRSVDGRLKQLRGGSGDDDESADDAKDAKAKKAAPKKPVPKKASGRQLAELEDKQDELRSLLLKVRLQTAEAYYEKSRAFEPKSKEWEAALTESTKQYKEFYEKYRKRTAGLLARYYQGRNEALLGNRAAALTTLADIRGLEGDGFALALRAKGINSSLECWLEEKKYEEFDERLQKAALAPLPSGRIDADWLGMKYRAALLLQRRAEALAEKDKSKKPAFLRDAKKLATEVAKLNKDFSPEARKLLLELGKDVPDESEGPLASFQAGMDAVRTALTTLQARQAAAKQAEESKDPAAIEAARKEIAAERGKVITSLKRAMPLAQPDDVDALNQARGILTYLLYEEGRLHEAAALGDFLLVRYPGAKASQQAAKVALASWQTLQKKPPAAWADEAKRKCSETAAAMMRAWPERPEAADAAAIAIAAAIDERNPDAILAILKQVPASSPRRAEVQLRAGSGLWREVQEKSRLDESARPTAETLASWREQAKQAIDEGLAAMPATGPASAVAVSAALARCQVALEDGDAARVAALLEHASYGPWTVLNGTDPAFTKGGLATATATAALRYYIEAQQNDKAAQAMKKLEELASASGSEASARLTAMYQNMGRDLQEQLASLATGPAAGSDQAKARAAGILTGFEKFLEGVAKDPKLSSKMWAATTYLNLGSGTSAGAVVPKSKAEGYLDKAAAIYEGLLAGGGDEVAKYEPSIRLKMANVYREREKWDEAQKQMDWILADKRRQNTLEYQVQAAEMLQDAASKAADKQKQSALYGQAITGYRKKTNASGGEIWAWGWAVISNRLEPLAFADSDEKALDARRKFFSARLNAVKCRLEKAEALPQERDKELQRALEYVDLTYKLHPELGGADTRKQFDKLVKEIEKRQNKPPRGIDGLKQAAEEATQ